MIARALFIAAILGAVVACTKSDGPIDPVWGKQACAHCSMLMSDRRFGAELVTTDGDRLFFDDVGCMVVYESQSRPSVAHEWVKDAAGANWIDARAARFESGSESPMGFGFEARASGASSWSDMRAAVLAREESLR